MSDIIDFMQNHPDLTVNLFYLALWSFFWAICCAAIDRRHGDGIFGFFVGFLFGVFGFIFIICLAVGRRPVPAALPETESEGWEMPKHEGPRRRIIIRKRQ